MAFEFRFYNAGNRISEMLKYDNPLLDQKESNLIAYHPLNAPEKDFFSVPREMVTVNGSRFTVSFDSEIMRRFGSRGVILVDKNLDPASIREDEPVACSDKEAQSKGERFWMAFMRAKADEWLEHCANVRQQGGFPKAAAGFHKHALETLGLVDPGATIDNAIEKKSNNTDVEALKKQVEELTKLVAAKK